MAFLFPKYFPFCIAPEEETQDIAVGSGTYYPIGMSLEDVMSLFWKSKNFTSNVSFSGSVTVTDNVQTVFVTVSYSQNGTLYNNDPFWPTKMSQMICGQPPYGYPRYISEADGTGIITSSNPDDQHIRIYVYYTHVDFFYYNGGIILRNKKYYPYINVYAQIAGIADNSYNGFISYNYYNGFISSVAENETNRIQSNALNIKVNGNEYMAHLYSVIYLNEYPFAPDSFSASFEITGLNDREAK